MGMKWSRGRVVWQDATVLYRSQALAGKGKEGGNPAQICCGLAQRRRERGGEEGREGDGQTPPKRAAVRLDEGRGENEKRNRV